MSLINLEELFSKKPYLKLYSSYFQRESSEYLLKKVNLKEEYYVSLGQKNLASSIAPKTSSQRSIGEKQIKKTDLVVVLGLANPHTIELLNEKVPANQIILFIDASAEILTCLWEKFLYPAMDIPGRHLFLGENILHLLWGYIESLPIERLSGIKFYRNQPSIQLFPEFYADVEGRISKLFSSKMSDLLTKFEFERIWVRNSISNLLTYNSSNPPRFKFKDCLADYNEIPAILVSAGPSLRSQCQFIKENRDKVFLFACDTALKVLLKFGIIPDGVMTLDAQTHSYFHFLGEDLSEIPIFADFVTSPNLLRNFNFKSIIHSLTAKFQVDASGKPFREVTAGGDIVTEKIGDIGDVQSGGSVATSAFDILRQMGFSPIYLVGQDLAYTGREIHSTGTHHNEKWLTLINRKKSLEKINEEIVRKRETKFVKACDGGTVLTDYVLGIYKHWFEESAKTTSLEIYNVSDKGSFIENMRNISTNDVLLKFKSIKTHDYPWRKLPPWLVNCTENIGSEELKKVFLKEIDNLNLYLDTEMGNNAEDLLEKIETKLEETPYLKQMIRKTEIYIRRHEKDLSESRKKEILYNSLKKEIRFLKRGVLIG
ncbi:MAG: motility associated factor glycosyltransferase family protein [Leptospiraceae bacterium]|nr:motility associated factor glycosyltransferase family protein [Leptospiraceae bacterium]